MDFPFEALMAFLKDIFSRLLDTVEHALYHLGVEGAEKNCDCEE